MIPDHILNLIKWETFHEPKPKGGQQVGVPGHLGAKLICEELEFEIGTSNFRSLSQCRDFCLMIFELFLQESKVI